MPYTPGSQNDGDGWDSPTLPAGRMGEAPGRRTPLGVFGPDAPTQIAPRRAQRQNPRLADPAPPPPPDLRAAPRTTRVHRPRRRIAAVVALLLLLALIASLISFANRALAFGSAISSQAPLSTQTGFMSGVGRVNVLVLGYVGLKNYPGTYLTDSMMVISFVPGDHATTMISTPRDLWVQVPPNSGDYSKLNSAYANGFYNGYNNLPPGRLAAGTEAAAKVSEITGLTIPYFLALNYTGFGQLVDAIGGVDINVPTTIVLDYPSSTGWVKQFNKGPQHMDGKLALEYARARHVLSPASQGTDFARAARQQQLIRAIIDRLRNPTAWPDIPNAMDALQKTLYSNLSLADLSALMLKLDLNHAARVGLTTSNVLVNAVSTDGQDILLPENGDWSVIPRYINSHLKQ